MPPPPRAAAAVWSKLLMLLAPFLKRWTYNRMPEQVQRWRSACALVAATGSTTRRPTDHVAQSNPVCLPCRLG
jgi:hypothetical protein